MPGLFPGAASLFPPVSLTNSGCRLGAAAAGKTSPFGGFRQSGKVPTLTLTFDPVPGGRHHLLRKPSSSAPMLPCRL